MVLWIHACTRKTFCDGFNNIPVDLIRRQFSQDPAVLIDRDIVQRTGAGVNVAADIRIFGGQSAVRRQGECWRISAAGYGGWPECASQ